MPDLYETGDFASFASPGFVLQALTPVWACRAGRSGGFTPCGLDSPDFDNPDFGNLVFDSLASAIPATSMVTGDNWLLAGRKNPSPDPSRRISIRILGHPEAVNTCI